MMRTLHKMVLTLLTALAINVQAQFNLNSVQYWVGSGSDSSILVVDFQDDTWDSSYAWGYLHNGTAIAADMLNAIAAADVNFSVATGSGFLNDIIYGTHSGVGGTGGFFWSTWTGTSVDSFAMNAGISEVLSNGEFFGCSFTDFAPAIAPGGPIAAFEPFKFIAQDVDFWVGTGTDSAILVVDFLSATGPTSFAWGFLFNGVATGEQMLNAISAADPNLNVAIGSGFLNDITYNSLSGIGGSPNFWGTWSATNLGNWDFNIGIGDTLQNGELFGCSYTNFAPALRPNYPVAVPNNIGINELSQTHLIEIYPNPAHQFINLELNHLGKNEVQVNIVDAQGRTVWSGNPLDNTLQIDISDFVSGVYNVLIMEGNTLFANRFVKK